MKKITYKEIYKIDKFRRSAIIKTVRAVPVIQGNLIYLYRGGFVYMTISKEELISIEQC